MSLPILAHLVRDKAAELGDATILTFVDVDRQGNYTEETRSYRELWSRGQALARWLASRGLAKGDRFAVMMANHPEFVDLMVASSILGTVFVPIDPRSRGDKLRFMLEFAGCRGVFAGLEALPAIDEAIGTPAEVGGDQAVAFADRPEIWAFLEYLTTPEAGVSWSKAGGALFPYKGQDLANYSSELDKVFAETLVGASFVRFDGADAMPAARFHAKVHFETQSL